MTIMTILGSPRTHGNTATLLAWMEEQFRADGDTVDRVDISRVQVRGCGECRGCSKESVELCAVQDDANDIFRRMVRADLVLFASPLFCWGFPAPLKALVDRMYCLMDLGGPHPSAPRIHGKRVGLLLTAGGGEADNADLLVRGFERLVEYAKARNAGHVVVTGCVEPSGLGIEERKRVLAWARELVAAVSAGAAGQE